MEQKTKSVQENKNNTNKYSDTFLNSQIDYHSSINMILYSNVSLIYSAIPLLIIFSLINLMLGTQIVNYTVFNISLFSAIITVILHVSVNFYVAKYNEKLSHWYSDTMLNNGVPVREKPVYISDILSKRINSIMNFGFMLSIVSFIRYILLHTNLL